MTNLIDGLNCRSYATFSWQDDHDDYNPDQEDNDPLDDEYSSFRTDDPSGTRDLSSGRRRSTRASKANGVKTPTEEWNEWKGERRSTRLGAPPETQLDGPRPAKRARTVDSTTTTSSNDGEVDAPPQGGGSSSGSGIKIKIKGAARMKPTETAVETVAGKKRSKFWYYAVEPVAGSQTLAPVAFAPPLSDSPVTDGAEALSSGQENGMDMATDDEPSSEHGTNDDAYQQSNGGSISPRLSIDET